MSQMTDQTVSTSSSGYGITPPSRHSASGLFVFLLVAAYAMFSLLLVLIGVKAYRNVVQASEQNAELRTTIGYISGRVRASEGTIGVTYEGEFAVMRISDALGEEDYETRIYFAPVLNSEGEVDAEAVGGALYEQVVDVEEEFDWEMGEMIMEIGGFKMAQENDMIELELMTKDAAIHKVNLRLFPYQIAPKGGDDL